MARVALVTGGTRGIGYAISKRLKEYGCVVAAGYSGNDEAAKKCADELGVMVVKGNVGNFEDCKRAVAEVEAALGPIDILVNNAGITRDGVFHKMTPDQWGEVISVNMNSAFNMTRQVIEGMRERSWGRIINISSINGQKGQMGQTNYSAAKAGLIGLPRRWRRKTPRRASPSMSWPRATSTPRCCRPCRKMCWPASSPASRSDAWARPRRSPRPSPSWPTRTPPSSPGRP